MVFIASRSHVATVRHTIMPLLPSFADRVWFAYHSLPRDENGNLPSFASLEKAHELGNNTIRRAASGARTEQTKRTFRLLAEALRVSESWLEFGGANGPTPTGVVPPRPGMKWLVHGEVDGWAEAVIEAKAQLESKAQADQNFHRAAFRAGATWPLIQPCDRITPEIAFHAAGLAWQFASPEEKSKHVKAEILAEKSAGRPPTSRARRQGRSA
jgi:hypothetical protein